MRTEPEEDEPIKGEPIGEFDMQEVEQLILESRGDGRRQDD